MRDGPDKDILIARRTDRGAVAVEVMKNAPANWKKNYGVGVAHVDLRPGEAEAINLDDIRLLMRGVGSLEKAIEVWREERKAS